MWARLICTLAAIAAFLAFLHDPSLDTSILAWPALMTAAIYAEEWWEGRGKPETDDGPHCPHCKYDVRATPFRCPECGLILKPNYDQNGLHIAPGHAMTQRL